MICSNHIAVDSNKTVTSGGKLWLSDGTTDTYTGVCLFFLRSNLQRAVTTANIHQVYYFVSCIVIKLLFL